VPPARPDELAAAWNPLAQRLALHAVPEEDSFYQQLLPKGEEHEAGSQGGPGMPDDGRRPGVDVLAAGKGIDEDGIIVRPHESAVPPPVKRRNGVGIRTVATNRLQ